jgi:predicted transposase YdaD
MGKGIAQGHDHLFKLLLEQPGVAGALFRERLAAPMVSQLAGEDPELLPGDFVSEEMREHLSDLLFRLPLREPSASLFCILEHKSTPDRHVGFQLLRYQDAVWQALLEQGEVAGGSFVASLVVYHGPSAWSGPRRFSEGLSLPAQVQPGLDFPISVFDLWEGEETSPSAHPWLRAGLRLLRHGSRPLDPEQIRPLLATVFSELNGISPRVIHAAAHYILDRWVPASRADLEEAARSVMAKEEQRMVSKAAEEYMAQGRAEGLSEGRTEATRQTEARILLRLLETKFGSLPSPLRSRVLQASLSELELWLERVLSASSIEEVLGDSS